MLIVDDDEDIRQLLSVSLGAVQGIDLVGEAADGEKAVEQTGALAPDIVVMDLMMPAMDGAAATAEIRRLYPDVMVIGFTAHDAGGAERLLRAGAVSVIEKTSFPRLMDLILNLRNNAAS